MKDVYSDDPRFVYYGKSMINDLQNNQKKGRGKRRNPRLLGWGITLFDLLLILVIFIFLLPYFSQKGTQIVWNDYVWTLRSQNIMNETLVILHVKADNKSDYSQKAYTVKFYNNTEPLSINSLRGILPEPKQEETLRIRIPALEGNQLRAIIYVDESELEISHTIIKKKP